MAATCVSLQTLFIQFFLVHGREINSASHWSFKQKIKSVCCQCLDCVWCQFLFIERIFGLLCCSTLLEPMEALLQLMLKWDPVQRGGRVNTDTKKPLCFEVLEQILSMKVSSGQSSKFYLKIQTFHRCFPAKVNQRLHISLHFWSDVTWAFLSAFFYTTASMI